MFGGLGVLLMIPQAAHAGVSVSFRFGTSAHRSYVSSDPVCAPPVYSHGYSSYRHHGYYQPQRVVMVRQELPVIASASYYQLGRDWAKDLRNDVATWDQFVNYLRSTQYSTTGYTQFREGFLSAYGIHGERAFDKAYQQAGCG